MTMVAPLKVRKYHLDISVDMFGRNAKGQIVWNVVTNNGQHETGYTRLGEDIYDLIGMLEQITDEVSEEIFDYTDTFHITDRDLLLAREQTILNRNDNAKT